MNSTANLDALSNLVFDARRWYLLPFCIAGVFWTWQNPTYKEIVIFQIQLDSRQDGFSVPICTADKVGVDGSRARAPANREQAISDSSKENGRGRCPLLTIGD
jgi:hypothetical protein